MIDLSALVIFGPILFLLICHWNEIDNNFKPYKSRNEGYHSVGYTDGFFGRTYHYEKDK